MAQNAFIRGIGPISGARDPILNEPVMKWGAATGKTIGRVVAIKEHFRLMNLPNPVFSRRFEVQSSTAEVFARKGDSGAAVVTEDLQIIGIIQAVRDPPNAAVLVLPWPAVVEGCSLPPFLPP